MKIQIVNAFIGIRLKRFQQNIGNIMEGNFMAGVFRLEAFRPMLTILKSFV